MGVNTAIKATPVTEDELDRFERFKRFEEWERSQDRRPPQRAPERAPAAAERTVGEMTAEWLGTLKGREAQNRASQARHFSRPFRHAGRELVLASLRPSECSKAILTSWQTMVSATPSSQRPDEKLSPGTVHQVRMCLQTMFSHFVKAEELTHNPVRAVEKVKGRDRMREGYATYEDTERYAAAMPWIGGYIARHLFATGLRIQNLLQLQKHQIDWEASGVNVIQKGGGQHFAQVPAPILEEMRRLCETFPASPWVYPSPRDQARCIPYETFRSWNTKVRNRLQLKSNGEWFVPHMFRHGCGDDMIAHGADITEVQRQLGHINVKQSARYVRIRGKAAQRVLDRQNARYAKRGSGP
jgi:integrase